MKALKPMTSPTSSLFEPGRLIDKSLCGVDPCDPNLTPEVKRRVTEEARKNMAYYFHVLFAERARVKAHLLNTRYKPKQLVFDDPIKKLLKR